MYPAIGLILLSGLLFSTGVGASDVFPSPAALQHDVDFWKRVYTEIDTKQGYIHDAKDLSVVYEKINLPKNASRKTSQRYIKKVKKKYIAILNKLARGKHSSLSRKEKRVLALWPKGVNKKTLRAATKRIRFQRGQSNKFKAGLVRSGMWKPFILGTLEKMGLPEEIAALPHVESSFNHKAYSKVGAAGVWQIMPATGRRFMRVDHVIDERMDPMKATIAASQLLEYNFKATGTWPLALIAYNHGSAGMRRAVKKMGTSDITTILRNYRSRTFKFASRNFYVAFLAAVEIDKNPEKYFGKIDYLPPVNYEFIKIPDFMAMVSVEKALGVSRAALKETNHALRKSVWNGTKHIPKNYELIVDKKYIEGNKFANNAIASIDSRLRFSKQEPDRYHRVRRGQTLSTIAARYSVKVSEIVALNNLRNRNSIRAGSVLRLPQKGKVLKSSAVLVAENRSPDIGPLPIPENGRYRVRRGDSLDYIAKRFGMTAKEIQKLNHLRNKNNIRTGQRLILAKAPVKKRKPEKIQLAKVSTPPQQPVVKAKEKQPLVKPKEKQPSAEAEKKQPTVGSKEKQPSVEAEKKQPSVEPQKEDKIVLATAQDEFNSAIPEQLEFPISLSFVNKKNDLSNKNSAHPDLKLAENVQADEPVVEMQPPSIAKIEDIEPPGSTDVELGVVEGEPVDTNGAGFNEADSNGVDSNGADSNGAEQFDESIGTSSTADSEYELLADPSDYSVSSNKRIEIQAAETLGHYAEWLQLRASRLRRINSMRYGTPVVVGKRLKLDFSRVTPAQFERERVAYHRTLQGEFFERFQIVGEDKHKLRRGQSIWVLAKRKYRIPIWLLRQYNPDLDLNKVHYGTYVIFPRVEVRPTVEVVG